MTADRLLSVAALAAVYLLSLGSADPLDAAAGIVLAAAVSAGLRGRLEQPQELGPPSLAARAGAFPRCWRRCWPTSPVAPGRSPCGCCTSGRW
ncbi:MAG TPA: hypothetical protein VLA80_02955, partial [Actinomycetota bacterium]|nr:hypothetical protein [Actinomycetota bacterium]